MRKSCMYLIVSAIVMLGLTSVVTADVPRMMNYQGRLTDLSGNPVPDSTFEITFRIWDDSAIDATVLWTEPNTVTTGQGLFSVVLGIDSPLPASVFDGSVVYLGIRPAGQSEIYPRTPLITMPYAYRAINADSAAFAVSIADDAVNSAKIEDESISFIDIGSNGAEAEQIMKWDGFQWYAANDETGFRRLAVDSTGGSTSSDTFVQVGTTLLVGPDEVSQFIQVLVYAHSKLWVSDYAVHYASSVYQIRIGESGAEDVKVEEEFARLGACFGMIVEQDHTFQYYYEPTDLEKANGINIQVYMKVTVDAGNDPNHELTTLKRLEVFGI